MKSCIVIGSNGFIGSAVASEASIRGYQTIEITRDNYHARKGASADLLVYAGGNSRKFIDAQDPGKGYELSVTSVMRVLQDFKFRRMIHLSSGAVYPVEGNPVQNSEAEMLQPAKMTRYGFHKWLAEQLVAHYVPDHLILRLGGFVGPGLKKNAIYDLLSGGPLFVHPDSEFQYMDTRVLARFIFDFAEADQWSDRLLNFSSIGTIRIREAARLANRVIPEDAFSRPFVRAELNVDKAGRLAKLSTTMETVRQFLVEHREARVKLA